MAEIVFILSGVHRRKAKIISEIERAFSSFDFLILETNQYGHAVNLAKQSADEGAGYVIATGGDGTLHEVVNGVMQSQNRKVIVGLLPCGTGNDFSKTVDVRFDTDALSKAVKEKKLIRKLDVGLVSCYDGNGVEIKQYFINIADVGIGGFIAQKLTGYSDFLGADFKFQRAILSTFLSYKKQRVTVQADSFSYDGSIMSLVMANGRFFGSGLGIAPDAKPDDGIFEVVTAGDISMFDYLRKLPAIRKSKKINHPEVKYYQTRNIQITHKDQPLPIDMDGEFVGYTPMQLINLERVLSFVVPV